MTHTRRIVLACSTENESVSAKKDVDEDVPQDDDGEVCIRGATCMDNVTTTDLPALRGSYHAFGKEHNEDAISTACRIQLPWDMVKIMMEFLDGVTLLACTAVNSTWLIATHDVRYWRAICIAQWPFLHNQIVPQLPGAIDYDLIRIYGGSWKSCFLQHRQKRRTAESSVRIRQFASCSADRVVSDTFSIGDHRFCLWVFPRGNPNEPNYHHRALSVYLVLTDLDKRPLDWLTCAVFTLTVVHSSDPTKNIVWHSSLSDNKFNATLSNWGVHSLGEISLLQDPALGYINAADDGSLHVATRVHVLTLTIRLFLEDGFMTHQGLGLGPPLHSIELPFCATLGDLYSELTRLFPSLSDVSQCRLWSFSPTMLTGQARRPRKCLSTLNVRTPLFNQLLHDGTDMDAYSRADLFVDPACLDSFVFVKILDRVSGDLRYVGRLSLATHATPAAIAAHLSLLHQDDTACSAAWRCVKEECAPQLCSNSPLDPFEGLQPSDMLIFAREMPNDSAATWIQSVRRCFQVYLDRHYDAARALAANARRHLTLSDVETIMEQLDIPRFRLHSVFAKCDQDARRTLRYIMEGRHLGFICDSCGETDFRGVRFNCRVCTDYDLCHGCFGTSASTSFMPLTSGATEMDQTLFSHRYANVDGKWTRVVNFQGGHQRNHDMMHVLPVFFK
ncbi:unnamed protein product [Aphanomyces euteiches]